MGVLHDELMRLIGERCTDAQLAEQMLKSIFAKRGISLSDVQIQTLVGAIDQGRVSDGVDVEGLEEPITISSEEIEDAELEFTKTTGDSIERGVETAIE